MQNISSILEAFSDAAQSMQSYEHLAGVSELFVIKEAKYHGRCKRPTEDCSSVNQDGRPNCVES